MHIKLEKKAGFVSLIVLVLFFCFILTACFNDEVNSSETESDEMSLPQTITNLTKDIEVIYPNNLDQILNDEVINKTVRTSLYTSLAKNESEGMQVILKCDKDNFIEKQISISDLTSEEGNIIPSSSLTAYRQHYIEVTEPSVNSLKTGFYPDALIPITENNSFYRISKGNNQAYWFKVKTNSETAAGIYEGKITFTFDCGTLVIPFEVEVWDFDIPVKNTFQSSYAIWPDMLTDFYGSDTEKMLEKYYWFQNEYRIESSYLPISSNNDVEKYVAEAEKYIKDEKVSSYNIPFYYTINKDGTIDLMKEKNIKMLNLLKEKNLLEKGYYYLGGLIDEPTAELYDRVKSVCELLNEIAPEVPHIVTTRPKTILSGYVDTWCPLYNEFDEDIREQYVEKGDSMWWYGCVTPKTPYPNYHIDSNLIYKRIVSWMQKDYNITGTLYWSTNIYKKYDIENGYGKRNVWGDPMAFPGAAGDGFLIYPGQVGDGIVNMNVPVPTLRLEALRDGVEDLEYLVILEKKIEDFIEKYDLYTQVTKDEVMQSIYSQLYTKTNEIDSGTERLLKMRELIANYILTGIEQLTVIDETVFNDDLYKTSLKVYAPKNANISVNNKQINCSQEFDKTSVYKTAIESDGGDCIFTVRCDNVIYEYLVNCRKPLIINEEKQLFEINEENAELIHKNSKTVKEAEFIVFNGKPSIKVVFNDDEPYPQINIPATLFKQNTDWSDYTHLSVTVQTPETNEIVLSVFVILSNQSAFSDEGFINNIFSGETRTEFISLATFKRLEGNYSDMQKVSISAWGDMLKSDGSDGNTTVYISDIKLLNINKN